MPAKYNVPTYEAYEIILVGDGSLCFLDSDDMIAENALEELYETAEEQQSDIIFYNLEMQVEGCEISQGELGILQKR